MKKLSSTIALLLVTSFSANAAIYTWKDDAGVTHFSEEPVQQAQKLNVKTTKPSSSFLVKQQPKLIISSAQYQQMNGGCKHMVDSYQMLEDKAKHSLSDDDLLAQSREQIKSRCM